VLNVEDWAEIRRLYRAERMPIKVIARVVGCWKEHGAGGDPGTGPAVVCEGGEGVAGRRRRIADP
jgi:hypothetical protein